MPFLNPSRRTILAGSTINVIVSHLAELLQNGESRHPAPLRLGDGDLIRHVDSRRRPAATGAQHPQRSVPTLAKTAMASAESEEGGAALSKSLEPTKHASGERTTKVKVGRSGL